MCDGAAIGRQKEGVERRERKKKRKNRKGHKIEGKERKEGNVGGKLRWERERGSER